MTAAVLEWLVLFLTLNVCTGLYEDQIGKFEWRQQYIGKLKFSHIDIVSPIKKVVVATEKNVLSAVSLKSGEILWRQILEQEESSHIQFMSVDNEIITISGHTSPLVRGWEIDNGHLVWEWGITPANVHTKWLVVGPKLVQIDFYANSHLDVTLHQSSTGRKLRSQNIPATWLVPEQCVLQRDNIACITNEKMIYSVKLTDGVEEIEIKVHHKSLLDLFKEKVTGTLYPIEGPLPVVAITAGGINRSIILSPEIEVLKSNSESGIVTTAYVDQQKLIASVTLKNDILDVTTRDINGEVLPELSNKINYPDTYGTPEHVLFVCQTRRDRGIACRILLSTSHHVLALLQHPGRFLWSREESLASTVTVEMIDLPVSDTDAAIEKEFDNKDRNFLGMFFRRLMSQSVQLQNLLLTILGMRPVSAEDKEGLIHDEFGLHKLIVAVTAPGKVFGIDNLSGSIVWEMKVDDIEPYYNTQAKQVLPLFVLRTARHFPYPALCALLGKHKTTKEGVLVVFNPITGTPINPSTPTLKLGFKVKQTLLLHLSDEEFSKGILFLDDQHQVHVYPETSKPVAFSQASSTFFFTADTTTGLMEGFTLAHSTKDKLIATKVWQIRLGEGNDKIIAVVGKNSHERVHSQGRVLGDRSVLYKYVNPNLVAVFTQGNHPSHKTVLNLHLLDVVSGTIVFSASHRRAKDPLHVVHSENWLVYTYISEKYRRTELAALEMYEGKTQSNATVFSSVDSATLLPIVERQAYILPANVLALKETITEKGITSKHILVALATGGILELPWVYVDPRRPITVTPEMREEGVIPYMPELPIPYEAIVNHNQTVSYVREIHTSSSGLESTCLVFAYGLDIFYTRVAPSKTFDLLKDDFDYYLITTVLVALTATSYLTKKLSSRKAIKQAWK